LFKLVQTFFNLSKIGLNLSWHAKCSFKQRFGWSLLHKWGQNLLEVAFKNLSNLLKLILKSSSLSEIVQIGLDFFWHAIFSSNILVGNPFTQSKTCPILTKLVRNCLNRKKVPSWGYFRKFWCWDCDCDSKNTMNPILYNSPFFLTFNLLTKSE
jgi:hypothetical protein